MLIGGLIGVVIVVAVVVAVVLRSRTQDDEHSVEHYHRQLHTLEEMQTHPATDADTGNGNVNGHGNGSHNESGNGSANGSGEAAYPASAFRVSGSSTVRLTESGRSIVPPVPPPPVPNPGRPVTFGDENDDENGDEADAKTDTAERTFMTGKDDRAMHGINHRPRRLAGPAAAVAAVLILIAVLIVTGLHTTSPSHHGKSATTPHTPTTVSTTHNHPRTGARRPAETTTSTTAAPAVSGPQGATAHAATYQVAGPSYSLALSANGGECWVEATDATSGSVLFTATLFSGQSHTIAATGPVTVIAGAPGAFAATINGAAVALPPGNQAPFTFHFQSAPTAA